MTVLRKWWILLAVLFLLPRLALLFVELGRPLRGDELSYAQIAHNVATGHGFAGGEGAEARVPTAVRGPVYVLLVAAFERIFGPTRTPVFLFQVLLDALALVLVVRIARAWFASGRTAWLAGALYATYPPVVIAVTSLLTETLTHVTLLAWVAFFFRYLDRRRWRDLVVASVALGLCALGKPALVLFGDSDPIFSPRAAERIAQHIPGALEPEIVEGAGHFLQEDKGAEIGRRIAAFVSS